MRALMCVVVVGVLGLHVAVQLVVVRVGGVGDGG
jgi:hypothetical protein